MFLYDADGQRIGFTYNDTPYLYVYNATGDVVGIVDDTLTMVVEYTYSPWGEILSTTGDEADTIGVINPFRYRGYYYDEETGLYYLNARYYDPETGRFISADTSVSTGQGFVGNNMFAYCVNNPVNYYDPTGDIALESMIILTIGIISLMYMTIMAETTQMSINSNWLVELLPPPISFSDISFSFSLDSFFVAKSNSSETNNSSDESEEHEYKKPVSGKSGKEAAKDVPSWAKGNRPYKDESGNDFAKRLLDSKYGKGNYKKGPGSEYNKIRKWGDRGFE